MKHLSFFAAFYLLLSCGPEPETILRVNTGRAQGSTYMISYVTTSDVDYGSQIDSILLFVDMSMSTWVAHSKISQINNYDTVLVDSHFNAVLHKAYQVNNFTNGAFDITVGPLVNAWGFGPTGKMEVDSAVVDSLMQFVGMSKVYSRGELVFLEKGAKIDFNAIAQGYTVDMISEYLHSKDIDNFMVEVGGELRTHGRNLKGTIWTIGIDKPQDQIDEEARFQVVLALDNKGLATSGNYRKFWVDETTGQKFAHTIDPRTGFPVLSNLLSATVIAETAMEADAYATAFMVMGLEGTKKFLENRSDLQVYLIYSNYKGDWEVWMTPNFDKMIR